MTIGPILPGRIPASLVSSRLNQNLQLANRSLLQLQEQIITGQKFFLPSESPAAATRTIVLQKSFERNTQLQLNVNTDKSFLAATEASLQTVSDALNNARAFTAAGIGDSTTSDEKQALADQVGALLDSVVSAGNTKFRGRYLFGGSFSASPPFELAAEGQVRYNGDTHQVNSYIDVATLLANNFDGNSAFGALSEPVGDDINPALTNQTKIRDLLGGAGVQLGTIKVKIDDTIAPETLFIDLKGAKTIGDVELLLEDAFAGSAFSLDVTINATNDGLQISSPDGTVEITDVSGSLVAANLGIASGPVAQIDGLDLNPSLTLGTKLSALNGGTGIGATAGNGLLINNGTKSAVVDLDGAVTVEDVFNALKAADLDLHVEINSAGDGFAISSRISGGTLSIAENNGSNAAALGLLTFSGTTLLSDLNLGEGVEVDSGVKLKIDRRDGSSLSIDLAGTATVQDVLDTINAANPPYLVASLNTAGNGIVLTDHPELTLGSPVDSLNLGEIVVTLNDGLPVTKTIDLSGAATISDVKTAIETAFPGPPNVTVDINPATGHGLRLTASSGTVEVAENGAPGSDVAADLGILGGPLTVIAGTDVSPDITSVSAFEVNTNAVSTGLGIAGRVNDANPTASLVGEDVNPLANNGVIDILAALEIALRREDDAELLRLTPLIEQEFDRFNQVRGEIGSRLQLVDDVENRLLDAELQIQQSLSVEFDADITELITNFSARQNALQATLQMASQTLSLSILNFL